jgi:hypothetical protein
MAEIDGVTLRMAIQAVDAVINDLAKQLGADDSPQAGELELRLLKYEKALEKLKVGYEEEQKISSNLPPFEKLVKDYLISVEPQPKIARFATP